MLPVEVGKQWWLALVTFERREHHSEFLPDDFPGACGWMGCLVGDEGEIRNTVEAALAEVNLRLIEIGEQRPLVTLDELSECDNHLAENIEALEPGKHVVWGTIHTYLAEGEA